MNILEQLGINHTYFYQFGIFVFSLILLQFIFKDFQGLLVKREQRTLGGEALAKEELKKSADLHAAYEAKARALNGEIRSIYDTYRVEATAEYQKIISGARAESAKLIEESRHKVTLEITDASRKLRDEVPALAQSIVTRLLAKG